MRAQRVRGAESRIEKQSAKWTAEGAVKGKSRVFCDVGLTLIAGSMIVLRRAHSLCETEVAPRFIPSLMIFISSGTFLREQPVKVRVCTKH